jgi:hypothetical protein
MAPWASQMRRLDDGTVGQGPADDRPAEDIGAEIAAAAPQPDDGDGSAPPDPDEAVRRFVETVTAPSAHAHDGGWLDGLREYVPDAGPVPSGRFL